MLWSSPNGFMGSPWPPGTNIVEWGPAIYCAWVVRDSRVVGDTKRRFRKMLESAAKSLGVHFRTGRRPLLSARSGAALRRSRDRVVGVSVQEQFDAYRKLSISGSPVSRSRMRRAANRLKPGLRRNKTSRESTQFRTSPAGSRGPHLGGTSRGAMGPGFRRDSGKRFHAPRVGEAGGGLRGERGSLSGVGLGEGRTCGKLALHRRSVRPKSGRDPGKSHAAV